MNAKKNRQATELMIAELHEEARKKGQPRFFKSTEHFEGQLLQYLDACFQNNNRMPTKAGFARFTGTTVETVMQCEQYYPLAFKMMNDYFQDALVNCNANKNLMGIFVLKDQHKWQDTSAAGLTINYNNVSEGQLETWLRDANLVAAGSDDDE